MVVFFYNCFINIIGGVTYARKIVMDNYTTFINETAVDFGATSYKFLSENVENKILKGCLFVGENASGKTKILLSIKFLLDFLFKDQNVDFLSTKVFILVKTVIN